jgi:hypothetical protein
MVSRSRRILSAATSSVGIYKSSYTNLIVKLFLITEIYVPLYLLVDLFSDGEYLFVDPDNKLSKYAPKNWRSSHSHVSVPVFHFCFKKNYNWRQGNPQDLFA